jgi:hypothetical protein
LPPAPAVAQRHRLIIFFIITMTFQYRLLHADQIFLSMITEIELITFADPDTATLREIFRIDSHFRRAGFAVSTRMISRRCQSFSQRSHFARADLSRHLASFVTYNGEAARDYRHCTPPPHLSFSRHFRHAAGNRAANTAFWPAVASRR